MKLQEKILYCRKKAGLSQEALAEQLGVSRQAVSKWETGDAVPEVNKLLLLANAFGVTTDWLLSDAGFQEEKTADFMPTNDQLAAGATWVDAIPGAIGHLLRRYGWLFGVYLAFAGAGFTGIGALARYMTQRMFNNSLMDLMGGGFPGGTVFSDQFGSQVSGIFSNAATNNPVFIMGTFIMIMGIVTMIAGVILAVALKKGAANKA